MNCFQSLANQARSEKVSAAAAAVALSSGIGHLGRLEMSSSQSLAFCRNIMNANFCLGFGW